jgi:hypothetical protein
MHSYNISLYAQHVQFQLYDLGFYDSMIQDSTVNVKPTKAMVNSIVGGNGKSFNGNGVLFYDGELKKDMMNGKGKYCQEDGKLNV